MRFGFLKPRRDVASPEQVRGVREARGWTAERLADEVHASALEVSAWEAGAVRVPPGQAMLIRWMADVDAWRAALHAARDQSCEWVRENAPDLYERMFRVPHDGRLRGESFIEHVSGCPACQAARERARQIGGFPPRPDTSGSLRARYQHWVDRLPGWAQWPFTMAGLTVGFVLLVSPGALWMPDMLAAWVLSYVVFMTTLRVSPGPVAAAFVPELAAIGAGLLGWSVFPGNDLSSPRPWAVAAAVVVALVAVRFWMARGERRKTLRLAARRTPPPPLSPGAPDLSAAGLRGGGEPIRTGVNAGRNEH